MLSCGLCGCIQVDGMLSRAWWGALEAQAGTVRACPTCKTAYGDWARRLQARTRPVRRGHLRLVLGLAAPGARPEPRARGHLRLVS